MNYKKIGKIGLIWLSFFILFFGSFALNWIYKQFYRINYDEIMLVLDMGISAMGVDSYLFWSFVRKVILRSAGWAVVITALPFIFSRISKLKKYSQYLIRVSYGVVATLLVFKLFTCNVQFGSFTGQFKQKTDFYEREYVFPEKAKIEFPQKRNVLVIALESIEKSYASERLFKKDGLIPNITKLEKENITFSKYNVLPGMTHTIAAITGMVTGLPLFFTAYSSMEKMKGAYGLGQVFNDHGYETYSFFPASGKFSLKENFLRNKGFKFVLDGEKIAENLGDKLKNSIFGGVDDDTLFEFTKPKIEQIVKGKKPYFIFMETVNTHGVGYFTDACMAKGFKQKTVEDVIKCEDKIVYDFVQWFRAQDPSAVVILLDDHEQYISDLNRILSVKRSRPLANVFINTNIFDGVNFARPVAAFDFFPTIVESAGGIIQGCRMGLGTSLSARCANVKTLRERYNNKKLGELLESKNDLYYKLFTGK
jgi:phosphoglycerol transferase